MQNFDEPNAAQGLLIELTPLFEKLEINKAKRNTLHDCLNVFGDALHDEILAALRDVFYHEVREYYEIYNLIEQHTWDYYELMEITGMREQILLEIAIRNLKTALNEKVFKYVANKTEKDLEELIVKSIETIGSRLDAEGTLANSKFNK